MGLGVRDTPARRAADHRRCQWRARLVVVFLVVGTLTLGSLPLPPGWQQAWAEQWYPALQRGLAPVTSLLPVAALDIALVVLASGLAAVLWYTRRGALGWWSASAALACVAATGWLGFQVLWGWHYQTPSLEVRLAPQEERGPMSEDRAARARTVAAHAVDRLNALHGEAHARAWPVGAQARDAIEAPLRQVFAELGVRWSPVLPLPRRTAVDRYFRWAGIDGMTNPFGLEVILNSRLLDVERPHVLAHEWAHVAGFADESDASFVAWMAGVRAGGPQEYAAWLGVLPHLLGALPAPERRARIAAIGEGPMADLRAIAARADERSPAVQELAWRVYDRFLKANRVAEGVARYDAVTRLMLLAADERTGRLLAPLSWSRPVRDRAH
jgi:hypothetical protein